MLGLTLSGCATTPVPTPSASITSAPTPTLADAVNAFARFNTVLDGYVGGTSDVEEFEQLVTPEYFKELVIDDADSSDESKTVGASSFSDEKLVDAGQWGGHGDLALVVCRDISRTIKVDSSGAAVVEPRDTTTSLIVYFVSGAEDSRELLVNKVDKWTEENYCS